MQQTNRQPRCNVQQTAVKRATCAAQHDCEHVQRPRVAEFPIATCRAVLRFAQVRGDAAEVQELLDMEREAMLQSIEKAS